MMFEFTIYFWVLFLTALVTLGLAIYSWKQKSTPGAKTFAWLTAAITLWALAAAFEAAAVSWSWKIFFSKGEYWGFNATAVFFLIFSSEFTGYKQWLTPRNRRLIWILPLFNVALAATNEFHHLVWTGFSASPNGVNLLIYHHGAGFWLILFIIYAQLAAATVLLLIPTFRGSLLQRRQVFLLILAALVPWVGSVLYLLDFNLIPGLNLVPTSLMLTGAVLAWSLFRYQFLNLVPVARDLVLEKMWDGMLVTDAQHRIVDINPAIQALLELSSVGALGLRVDEDIPALKHLNPFLEKCEDTHTEIEWKGRFFEVRISPMLNDEKKIMGRLLIFHDITKRKAVEADREDLITELRLANSTKDRFFSIISHDLRNPINSIFSFTRLIKDHIQDLTQDEIIRMTHELNLVTQRTYTLLENLLEWAKTQTGTLSLNIQPLHIPNLVHDVLQNFTAQAKTKEITLDSKIPRATSLQADQRIIETILRNLISNALKFTPRGGKVWIEYHRNDTGHTLSVHDTGLGMAQETIDRLFHLDEKVSSQGTEEEKGSGLGLILCHELAKKHGGAIHVESEEGTGSVFRLILPE